MNSTPRPEDARPDAAGAHNDVPRVETRPAEVRQAQESMLTSEQRAYHAQQIALQAQQRAQQQNLQQAQQSPQAQTTPQPHLAQQPQVTQQSQTAQQSQVGQTRATHGAPAAAGYVAAPAPGLSGSSVGDYGGGHPPTSHQSSQADTQPKPQQSRSGALLAGLAIGALLGGVVGGGVAAVVAANSSSETVVSSNASGSGGTLSLNNPDSATVISGVAAVATPSVVTLEVASSSAAGSGSGVIYSEDGYILTNAHVVTLDGAASDPQIRVKLSDGRILDGTLVGTAPYSDVAVVKVEAEDLTPIQVGSIDDINVGDTSIAIGAPLNLANTVTGGVISSLNRGISVGSALIPQNPGPEDDSQPEEDGGNGFPWDFRFESPSPEDGQTPFPEQTPQNQSGGSVTIPVIQTDASINPGNSGGALLNAQGELIGINVAIASPVSNGDTAGSDGLGFAIPVNLATRVADAIIAGEKPTHGLLGASVGDSSQDTDEDANRAGGLILELAPGGAADKSDLRPGDVITAIDGIPAADGTSVSALVRMYEGESDVTISYTRGGEPAETTLTLGTLDW